MAALPLATVLVVDLQKVVDVCDEARALVGRLEKKATEERKRLKSRADECNLKSTELRKSSNLSDRDPKFYEAQKKLALAAAQGTLLLICGFGNLSGNLEFSAPRDDGRPVSKVCGDCGAAAAVDGSASATSSSSL